MISCLSAYGTGAALAIRQRIDEQVGVRELARRAGDTIRFSWVGAENVLVTRCCFTASSHASGSNLRSTTIGAPSVCVERRERERAGVVHRPGGEVHLVAELQAELAEQREHDLARSVRGAQRALRLAGGARRVDHLPRRRSTRRGAIGLVVGLAGEHVVPGRRSRRAASALAVAT